MNIEITNAFYTLLCYCIILINLIISYKAENLWPFNNNLRYETHFEF